MSKWHLESQESGWTRVVDTMGREVAGVSKWEYAKRIADMHNRDLADLSLKETDDSVGNIAARLSLLQHRFGHHVHGIRQGCGIDSSWRTDEPDDDEE